MPRWKKFSLAIAVIVVGAFAFLTWYKFHYSMEVAEPFEVIVPDSEHQVLIATQGSDFKNAVVAGVIEALQDRPVSIKGIDVSGLSRSTWTSGVPSLFCIPGKVRNRKQMPGYSSSARRIVAKSLCCRHLAKAISKWTGSMRLLRHP